MAIKLNSINPAVYDSAAKEFSNAERERADIVTCGRLLMRERLGRDERALRVMTKQPDDFTAMLADGEGQNSYSVTNRNLQKNLLLFCAKRVCRLPVLCLQNC